ncbi:MAG: hypothetical protein KC933_16750, partial [Myxococcales bacterium]|nr:hypothetical protein [Myxococcales bacterium]
MSHSEDRGQEAPRRSEPGFRRRLLTFNLLLFGVLSAAVFAMGTSLWLLLTPTLAQRLQNDTRYLADRLGKSLDVAAAAHDPKLVQEALREFEDDPDFHGMVVFQEDGGVLFEYPEGFSTREIGLHEVSPSQVFETRDHFAAWSPISVEGVPLGTVVVAYSKESLHMLGDWFMVFAAVVALFLVASILYALRFDVRFVAPFRQLSVFAGRIGEGHLDARLEPALGAAESRDLVRELNRMAEQLQSQHEALVAAREEALGASRAKSRFLANMSHEIRTPLNGVLGTADVMLTGPLPPDVRADVEMIRLSASGLLAIIEEILDLAKIEADRLSVEAVSTDLADVLHGAVAAVVPQVRKKGLALTARMLPGVPRFILSDGLRVRQILTNLLGNAAKFTEEGAIELTVAVQDDLLRFDVRDDGIGMTATQLEVVFEAFRQADTTTTRRYGGTGLGLAISQRLAQLLGGRLWADSEPGVGSTFHLELPLVPGSDAGLDAPPPAVVLGRAAEADQLRARFEAQGLPTAAPEPMVAVVCLSEPEEVEDFTEVLAEVRARGGKAVAVLPPDTLSARRLLEQGAVDLTLT